MVAYMPLDLCIDARTGREGRPRRYLRTTGVLYASTATDLDSLFPQPNRLKFFAALFTQRAARAI